MAVLFSRSLTVPPVSGHLTTWHAAGLAQIHHVAGTPLSMLELLLGNQAAVIQQFAHGINKRPLIPQRKPQKSYIEQETFAVDLTDEKYIEAV